MAQYNAPESIHLGTGVETVFGFTWPTLRPADVYVTLNGIQVATLLASPNTVSVVPAPAPGAVIRIYRNTPAQNPAYVFSGGIPFLPRYVDENNKQVLYALQEGLLEFNNVDERATRALAIAQQAAADASAALFSSKRAIRTPPNEPEVPELAPAAARAGKIMGFNDQGHPIATLPGSGGTAAAHELALDLASGTVGKGAWMIGHTNMGYFHTVGDILSRDVTVKTFGAKGDGVTDDTAAILAMAAAVGYIAYPRGSFKLQDTGTLLFTVPQFFREGAELVVPDALTFQIGTRIHAAGEWIFKGNGVVQFRIQAGSGEDSQTIRAGWFGVFPTNRGGQDITAKMQRCLSSLSSQTREGIVRVESGSFKVSGTMYVPRGVEVNGVGTRRTVWDVTGAHDYPVFVTNGNACKFTDFQFEYTAAEAHVRKAPYIVVNHNTCTIRSLWLFPSICGIEVNQPQCEIDDIKVTYGIDPKIPGYTDTCLIRIKAGAFRVNNVQVQNTTYYPHSLVHVGGGITVGAGTVTNIQSTSACPSVLLDARNGAVTRVNVSQIVSSPSAGGQFEAVVSVKAAAAYTLTFCTFSGIVGNSYADSLMRVEADGTAIVSDLVLGNAAIHGSGGFGVRLLNNSSNTMRDIYIGDDVDVSSRGQRLQRVGLMSNIVVPYHMKGANHASPVLFNSSIPPETAVVVDDYRTTIFAGILGVGSSSPNVGGIFSFRASTSANHITSIGTNGLHTETTTGSLSGTTGTPGKFTIGINGAGQLVLENRTGANVVVCVTLMAGA